MLHHSAYQEAVNKKRRENKKFTIECYYRFLLEFKLLLLPLSLSLNKCVSPCLGFQPHISKQRVYFAVQEVLEILLGSTK